jgi:hypothetical protein
MKSEAALKYFFVMIAGIVIIFAGSIFHANPAPPNGEYFLSEWLRNNFTWPIRIIFCMAGFAIGFFTRLNPFLAGISLSLFFPLIIVYEATVYRGSHNLIPAEILMYMVWSIPAIAGAYAGAYLSHLLRQRKKKGYNNQGI